MVVIVFNGLFLLLFSVWLKSDGTILGYFGNAFSSNRGIGQRGNLRVPRKVLRRILMDQLQSTKIYWGHRLMDYSYDVEHCHYRMQFAQILKHEELSTMTTTKTTNITASQATKMVLADLLVAADGIRSAVLTKLYRSVSLVGTSVVSDDDDVDVDVDQYNEDETKESSFVPHEMGLRSMGVRLILGIAEFFHPLLNERGFYTLDGKHRLFTMPYTSNRFSQKEPSRIMWQLSFTTDEQLQSSLDAVSLRDYVLQTCSSWHDPIVPMIHATPMDKIWGT